MNNIFRTLDRMRFENNLTDRQKHIIGVTLEHIEHKQEEDCKDCIHFKEGKQPDGILWQDCEHNFHCSAIMLNHFKKRIN